MVFTSHIPTFVDGVENKKINALNTQDLLEQSHFDSWKQGRGFHRFSQSENGRILMAEFKEGKEWWVIGFVKDGQLELPKWEAKQAIQMPIPSGVKCN